MANKLHLTCLTKEEFASRLSEFDQDGEEGFFEPYVERASNLGDLLDQALGDGAQDVYVDLNYFRRRIFFVDVSCSKASKSIDICGEFLSSPMNSRFACCLNLFKENRRNKLRSSLVGRNYLGRMLLVAGMHLLYEKDLQDWLEELGFK